MAESDLQQYHRHRLNPTTKRIMESVQAIAASPATLLDIGAGIGVLTHELLRRGAMSATLIDASSSYVNAARAEAVEQGHDHKIRFVHGDFVDLADSLPPAEVVLLDRVICCYSDYPALLERSSQKCLRAYAISYPRDRWYVRVVYAVQNWIRRLRRDAFRTYVHPEVGIRTRLGKSGLRLASGSTSPMWRVELYLRESAVSS